VWKDGTLEFKELPNAHGRFSIEKSLAYDAQFDGLPEGTTLSVDGVKVGTGSTISWRSSMTDGIAALSPTDALDHKFKIDPKKSATLTFSTGATVTFPLPAQGPWYALGEALKGAVDRPVSFGSKDSGKVLAHSVAMLVSSTEVLGPAKTMAEVDWVAIEGAATERAGKTCSGYTKSGSKGGPEKKFDLKLVDKTVSVIERTTSRVVAKREFRARNECPMMAFGGEAKSYPRTDEIKEWLRDLRSK
jgi:hypothetical protein